MDYTTLNKKKKLIGKSFFTLQKKFLYLHS